VVRLKSGMIDMAAENVGYKEKVQTIEVLMDNLQVTFSGSVVEADGETVGGGEVSGEEGDAAADSSATKVSRGQSGDLS